MDSFKDEAPGFFFFFLRQEVRGEGDTVLDKPAAIVLGGGVAKMASSDISSGVSSSL